MPRFRVFLEELDDVRLVEFRVGTTDNEARCPRVLETPEEHTAPPAAGLRPATGATKTNSCDVGFIPEVPEVTLLWLQSDE